MVSYWKFGARSQPSSCSTCLRTSLGSWAAESAAPATPSSSSSPQQCTKGCFACLVLLLQLFWNLQLTCSILSSIFLLFLRQYYIVWLPIPCSYCYCHPSEHWCAIKSVGSCLLLYCSAAVGVTWSHICIHYTWCSSFLLCAWLEGMPF